MSGQKRANAGLQRTSGRGRKNAVVKEVTDISHKKKGGWGKKEKRIFDAGRKNKVKGLARQKR